MKYFHLSQTIALIGISVFSVSILNQPATAAESTAVVKNETHRSASQVAEVSDVHQAILIKEQEIRTRLQRPAMLEVSTDPSEEAEIQELYRSGWIIEASLEEVEAAIKAAAATPSQDDDVAAGILAHRASCRFFLEPKK